ncbi:protein of unknown function (DUF4299) [Alteromonadaceae bacterium 2753L.S.0a.02]|nr:protein of unknown function (DUF4299) [Alteromonadaceae bacterium 2753L.S.0a.02]
MSFSFYLNNINDLPLTETLLATGYNDIAFVEEPSPDNDRWPRSLSHIYRNKISARALEIDYDGEQFQVRIMAASSPDDYKLALKLVWCIAKKYQAEIRPENSDALDLKGFSEQFNGAWVKQDCKANLQMLLGQVFKNPESTVQVSGIERSMRIGPRVAAQLQNNKATVAKSFYRRLHLLNYFEHEDIHQAHIVIMKADDAASEVHISSYAENTPTLIADSDTVVSLSPTSALQSSENKEGLYLPLPQCADLLGDNCLWVSENLLFAEALSGEAWARFYEQFKERAENDPMVFAVTADATQPATAAPEAEQKDELGLSKEQLEKLSYGPLAVFFTVAAADGDIDNKEIASFQRSLVQGLITESKIMQAAAALTLMNFEAIVQKFVEQELMPAQVLVDLVAILKHNAQKGDALLFCNSLVSLGTKVAEASGGWFGLFGNKISRREKEAIASLKALLTIL